MTGNEPHTSRHIIRGGDQATELKTLVQESIEETKIEAINSIEDISLEEIKEALGDQEIETTEQLTKEAAEEYLEDTGLSVEASPHLAELIKDGVTITTTTIPAIVDDPDTDLIETGWTKPNPCFKNGKLYVMSKSDGVQHIFEAETAEEAKVIAYADLELTYDISNLRL